MIEIYQPLLLSFKLAAVTTFFLLLISIPLALLLYASPRWISFPLTSFFSLPIVLPPSVLGFYLLVFLNPDHTIGSILPIKPFTFQGLVFGSIIYSLPFTLQPILQAYQSTPLAAIETAASLGLGYCSRFFRVILPMATKGIITGVILGFAHTLGEFGVILMIGGNIPGETRVASIAIFDHVEALEFSEAHCLSVALLIIAFSVLCIFGFLNKKDSPIA